MKDHFTNVAEAFSRKASVYDSFGEGHVNLTRMRRKVYDHISAQIPPGGYLLELNAGTGLDAMEMVDRGYRVHATDLSPGMIAEIKSKITCDGLQERLEAQHCSFAELEQVTAGPFDGIYSNFGGLNCIDDLTTVTRHLPRLLKPGATVTWVIMPPFCPWELAQLPRDPRVATRRLRRSGIMADVEGVRFMTTYFTVGQVRRAFGPCFRGVKLEGLSVFTPTADNKNFAYRFPRLYRWLAAVDDRLSGWPPFNGWGDFFILTMRYEGGA